MQDLTVTIIQTSLFWEAHEQNRKMLENNIYSINQNTDIIVLPEMFPTGFSMNPAEVAENTQGESFLWMQKMAKKKNAVIAGSIPIFDNNKYFNRFYWVEPSGIFSQYDKKHLFTFAGEDKHYAAGSEKTIIEYKGWRFLPLICYDLRFPVWSKNNYNNNEFDYDCLIYVANWPMPRSNAWKILLMARAIENQCYTIGVNRIGKDNNNNLYSGDSGVINPKGDIISSILPGQEMIETVTLSYNMLKEFRQNFKLGPDWDKFSIK